MEQVESTAGLTITTAKIARAAIANAFLAADAASTMGSIELQPHQLEACARLRDALSIFGGALLCDPVGTGKTFTALAIARSYRNVKVVAPSVLRNMWHEAAESCGVSISFASYESLSRGGVPPPPELLILDEAHHARNPATRRFAALAALAASSDVLLLSATPIHNRRHDIVSLLSIFLGERASMLSSAELAAIVTRRERQAARSALAMPLVKPLRWYAVPVNDELPQAILSLPPPVPLRDGGDGGALITHSLIRQWASSDAALRAGLNRRRLKASAIRSSLESGIWPTARELASWTMAEGSVQLTFASLIGDADGDVSQLVDAVDLHDRGIRELLRRLPAESERDTAMASIIRGLRLSHADIRIVAFSQYEETVRELFSRLSRDGHIAVLTGNGGRVAGGRITRAEVITRFAPHASGVARADRANDVTLLLTTDLLSEGVNLQDAGMVIHLDLPWTPARMEQRLGRVARYGSRHRIVHACAFRPPASAETVVRIERILAIKTQETVSLRNGPRVVEELTTRLRSWHTGVTPGNSSRFAATVQAGKPGFLAACSIDDRVVLIGSAGAGVTDDPDTLTECVALAEGADASIDNDTLENTLQMIHKHVALASALAGVSHSPARSLVRRKMYAQLSRAVETSRAHERPDVAAIAHLARNEIGGRMGKFRETELSRLLATGSSSLKVLATSHDRVRSTSASSRKPGEISVLALIVFKP